MLTDLPQNWFGGGRSTSIQESFLTAKTSPLLIKSKRFMTAQSLRNPDSSSTISNAMGTKWHVKGHTDSLWIPQVQRGGWTNGNSSWGLYLIRCLARMLRRNALRYSNKFAVWRSRAIFRHRSNCWLKCLNQLRFHPRNLEHQAMDAHKSLFRMLKFHRRETNWICLVLHVPTVAQMNDQHHCILRLKVATASFQLLQ